VSALAGVPAFAQMTVSLTAPAAGAVYTTPAYVILNASAQNASGSVARVEFYQGATLIGSDNSASYSVPWPWPLPGSYSLSARAIDAQGAATTSAPVSVTVVDPVAQVYYIHPDHLNTPRLIADAAGTTVWRWDNQEPFGNDTSNDDPNNTGNRFDFPLRFPGQYYDRETNLAYNHFRDYDPGTGRYIQSDPIGLAGGINTYLYVEDNPISFTDPVGLLGSRGNSMPTPPSASWPPAGPLGVKLGNPDYTPVPYESGSLNRSEMGVGQCRLYCVIQVGVSGAGVHFAADGLEHALSGVVKLGVKISARGALVYDAYELYTCLKECEKKQYACTAGPFAK